MNIIRWCGIFSAIILFLCMGIAICLTPWFSWTGNYLSNLGGAPGITPIYSAYGISSLFFNIGLIISGILGAFFALVIKNSAIFTTRLGRLGIIILFIDMLAFCGIGLFPHTLGKIHVYASILFFVLVPFFLFISGYETRNIFSKRWWIFTNALCIVSFLSVGMFLFLPRLLPYSKAVSEALTSSMIFIYCICINVKLLRLYNTGNTIYQSKSFPQPLISYFKR